MSEAEDAQAYQDFCEEAHHHPRARGIWGRLIAAHERRGLPFGAEALAFAALTLADAPRDPLKEYFRPCIRVRHGRPCSGVGCDCDIPF